MDPHEAQICSPLRRPSCNIFMPFGGGNGIVVQPVTDALLAEAIGAVRRQVGEGIGWLAAVAVLEVDVWTGGVARRPLIADQLALVHAVAGLDLEAQQVAVE